MKTKLLTLTILLLITNLAISHPGIGIVEDSKGNIFYSDLKQIWKISLNGRKTIAVQNVHTHELYIDNNDNLFGEHLWYNGERLNTWGHYVWKLSSTGVFEKVIPDKEGLRDESYSFVRDHGGHMFFADRKQDCQHVKVKKPDNTVTKLTIQCFTNIRWMQVDRKGIVYVVDETDLKKINKQGVVKTIEAEVSDRKLTNLYQKDQHSVYGIWDDKEGNIYTAVYTGRLIKKFTPDGKIEVVAETALPWSPSAGLVDRSDNLWILENSITGDVRVERITKDGTRKTF
jgi:hypothetical protein